MKGSPRPGRAASRPLNTPALVLVMLVWIVATGQCAEPNAAARDSILKAPGPTIKLRLLDAVTAQPLENVAVTVHSDNGIRCIRAPCPTNSQVWRAESDDQGYVELPKNLLQASASIQAASFSGDLVDDSYLAPELTWTVELLPEPSALAEPSESPRPIKLINAHTGAGIANASARIEYGRHTGKPRILDMRTNALGYVFLPFEIPDGAANDTWVVLAGYRPARIDYAWAQHRIGLKPL